MSKYHFGDKHIFTSRNSSSAGSDKVIITPGLDEELQFDGDINLSGDLDITGTVEIGGTLDVTGDTTLDSNLTVFGSSIIQNTLFVTGNTNMSNLNTTNDVDISGTLDVSGYTTLNGMTTSSLIVNNNTSLSTLDVSNQPRLKLDYFSYGTTSPLAGVLTVLKGWPATSGTGTSPPTYNSSTGIVTINEAGIYMISLTVTVSPGTNSYIQFRLFDNTALQEEISSMNPQSGNSSTNTISTTVSVANGQQYYADARGLNAITIPFAQMVFQKLF